MDLKKKRNITSVVVTHDIRAAKTYSGHVVLMDQGHIVAEGSFKDLQKSQDKFVVQFLKNGT
jgi:phospholipid/cholesterol/gamma-HCH transport system ATP-binding protein